jgi:hypothetical protein
LIISPEIFDKLQREWAPLDDVVFQLTPTTFNIQANEYYISLGCPPVSKGTFWDVYHALLRCFHDGPPDPTLENAFTLVNQAADVEMELLHGLQELRNIDDIIGDKALFPDIDAGADFTDSEGNDSDKSSEGRIIDSEVYGDFSDSEDE